VRGRRGAGWYAQRWPLLGDKQHTKAYCSSPGSLWRSLRSKAAVDSHRRLHSRRDCTAAVDCTYQSCLDAL